ncbi:hypothetical protein KCG44_10025 [Pacificimonas sp. WHA3]|uniref:Uncharacterized protein n=1 Tax=Pacificimonas pallii TaxID=2827236 RepID=A0ABS6SGF2_9SPHN|nr:hypothetical protein [Pacificimonas pallii]MBV7257118.1 hypothetical protein [Pacificimonas pallii]
MAAQLRYALERAGVDTLPVVRRGPADAPLVIFAQPLFEEHNRCRRLFADIGRALAEIGIGSALPDLPRTGDQADLAAFSLARARTALAAFIAGQDAALLLSVRGGALLAPETIAHLAVSPVHEGNRLLTDLIRTHGVAHKEATGRTFGRADADAIWQSGGDCHLAGYQVTAETAFALRTGSAPAPAHSLILSGRNPDVSGPPVWRQADPECTAEAAREISDRVRTMLASKSSAA